MEKCVDSLQIAQIEKVKFWRDGGVSQTRNEIAAIPLEDIDKDRLGPLPRKARDYGRTDTRGGSGDDDDALRQRGAP